MTGKGIPGKTGERSRIGASGGRKEGTGRQAAGLHRRAGRRAGRVELAALEDPEVQRRADQNGPQAPCITGQRQNAGPWPRVSVYKRPPWWVLGVGPRGRGRAPTAL